LRLCLRLCVCLCWRGKMTLKARWREVMGKGLEPGAYKYDGRGELKGHRFHLRVDSERKGVLLVDASHIIFLNGTALDHMRCALEDRSDQEAAKYLTRRYKNLDKAKAVQDLHLVRKELQDFLHGEQDVIDTIGPDRPTVGTDDFPAPYRLDLVLTYRCQNRCLHCYNEPRQMKELSMEQWKEVISISWKLGIPHIVFTGGEPTLFTGLDELVARSEEFGQVTGLVTNGRMLRTPGYLNSLVNKGLDHVQITILSHREDLHDELVGENGAWKETIQGLEVALKEDLYVSTNTTILRPNLVDMEDTLRFLVSLGVKNVAFNTIIRSGKGKETEGIGYDELAEVMLKLKQLAVDGGVRLIWYTPTPYCEFNPINFGLGIKQCTACALNMAVEPDGTVLPCQSYYQPLGNILSDPWERIWGHELCKRIRERGYLDGKCVDCGLQDTCGGGCPLSREHGDYICLDSQSSL
jgi:radical SAM protein with 4Fe4S-binding SPASM domain